MLHKKFKPSKCKTALNLAKSRIKLLKNKKGIQVKQLRRELAQLLESGQDQTARIRVEHVVREEKTMAAFELIEIYCELLVARLPILESQKDCPLDLKEAVTSLIFAAPRCGDIPELQDVRKHFTAKYGKEFVVAATELRPNCGVSRNLVEKLSAKAPDGPTKVKILTAIAEEHNIKWEPRWFEDENPVPPIEIPKEQHMEKAGKIQVEALDFGIADNFHHPHAHDAGSSKTSSQNHPRANIDVNEVSPSTSHPDGRRESYSNRKAFSHTSGIAENAVEAGRQSWNMEFKDATAAAQAAAESAERASMAARAAAELSRHSYIVNEASSRPLGSSAHGWNQDKNVYAGSVLKDKHVEEHPANTSFNQRTPRMQVDLLGAYQQGNNPKGTEATSFAEDSTESGVGSGNEREEYRESKNTVRPVYREVKKAGDSLPASSAAEAEYDVFESPKRQKYGNVPVDRPFHEETAKMKIQPDSFAYEYSSFGDEYGIFSNLNDRNRNYSDDSYYGGSNRETANNDNWQVKAVYHSGVDDDRKVDPIFTDQGEGGRISGSDDRKYRFHSGKDVFVSTDHGANEMDDAKEPAAHTDNGAVFDESGSDDDEFIFGHAEKSYDIPSSGKTSLKHFPFDQDSRSSYSSHPLHGLDVSESFQKSPLFAKLSEPLPVKFDSDGESSGSERELQNEKPAYVIVNKNNGKRNTNPDMGSANKESQAMYSDAGDLHTCLPSYGRRSPREELHDLDHATACIVVQEAKPEMSPPSSRLHSESSDPVSELEDKTQAGPEDGIELNLRLLPSGRKNRRMWDPPYRIGTVGNFSSSPRSGIGADGGPNPQVSSSEVENTHSFKTTSGSDINSIGDDPGVMITPKISNSAERPYILATYQTANRTWKDPTGYFHSNDSSSEDDTPKQPAMSKNLLGAGLSRRTKGSAARSVASSQPSTTREHIPESSSSATEVSPKLHSENVGSRSRHAENPGWDEPARRLRSDRKVKVSDNAYSSSSAAEKQLSPSDTQTPRASNSNEKAPSRENSTKKPGHVHPKLPDFETLTAHLQSLRTNRQQ